MAQALPDSPARPYGVYPTPSVNRDYTKEFIVVQGFSSGQSSVLGTTIDEIDVKIGLDTYERMENDAVIQKDKQILITNVLADDIQLAPGANEDDVAESEYQTFIDIMEYCERLIAGLDQPYRITCEQQLGNAIRYGHGIGEIEWEYRVDGPLKKSASQKLPQKKTGFASFFTGWFTSEEKTPEGPKSKLIFQKEQIRLMPKGIKVKPRGAALFVTDEYMNVLGLTPKIKTGRNSLRWDEIIDRAKFTVLTLNKQDEDPRGRSRYRAAFTWFNLKAQLPAELLRFVLQEAVPQAVGTLPDNMAPFEFVRDENGKLVYEDLERKVPMMKTAAESMADQIKGFRSGSGAVIPHGAKLEPFKKSGSSDADLFSKVLKVIDDQMEYAILLQTLAQSEGQHQNRAASSQIAELLYVLIFLLKWAISMMTLNDLFEVAVRFNFGDWAIAYLPKISFGDFVRRDWNEDLKTLADAYFKGFLDDTQRAELMSWMNLPKAGPSRQETMAQVDPTTGDPVMPNQNRPDKQPGNKNRNDGNGTEKKKDEQTKKSADIGRGPLNALGHHAGRFVRSARVVLSGRK